MIIVAAILAGGQSSRFGADKALFSLKGEPMIAHVALAMRACAREIAIVGHEEAARQLGVAALTDPADSVPGPLAGVLAALRWARARGADWLATAPCDAPLIPGDLCARLVAAAESAGASAAFAASQSGLHPLCAAWRPALAEPLAAFFARGVHPPVRDLAPEAVRVLFDDEAAFINVNTPADLARALLLLEKR
jgi:molybdenum cofactor guanylyltransferase